MNTIEHTDDPEWTEFETASILDTAYRMVQEQLNERGVIAGP